MQLFIMRHGEAEATASNDSLRKLTEQGCQDVEFMAATYAEPLSRVDVIWASPYTRAQQTAEIMSKQLQKPVLTQEFLPPNGHPQDVLNALTECGSQTVLMVSHIPWDVDLLLSRT